MQARLLLEDGTLFIGKAFGGTNESIGEVIFNTGFTGYQEILSDASNCGQIVALTYPLIGNYGINRDDFEAIRPFIHGLAVRQYEEVPSNWRAQYTLDQFLKEYGIPGISEIDTRMLTRIIRQHGTMKGIITTSNEPVESLLERMRGTEVMTDQVSRVSTKAAFEVPGNNERIVLVDFGAKNAILNNLVRRDCNVVVVPYNTTADEIRKLHPDGVVLSNGPGNPKDVPQAIEMIQNILGEFPVFGICLGHQLFALACGADTTKLKFGHRGGNHPVKDLESGKCYITSQNHSYAVTEESVAQSPLTVTHINNNDKTVEGLKHKEAPAFSVQYHPEGNSGPSDTSYLFDQFIETIRQFKIEKPAKPRQMYFAEAWEGGQA